MTASRLGPKIKCSKWEIGLTLSPGREVTGKVFKFGATAATCIEKNKSKDREKRLEALQSAFGKTKIGDDSMDIDSKKKNNEIDKNWKNVAKQWLAKL